MDVGFISLEGSHETQMLLRSAANEVNAEISPDGRWLAYMSNESGRAEIYLRPFPKVDASRRQVSTTGGTRPLWSRDGRELFYHVAPDTIMAVPVRLGDDITLSSPQPVVKGPYAVAANTGRHYDVSLDGQAIPASERRPAGRHDQTSCPRNPRRPELGRGAEPPRASEVGSDAEVATAARPCHAVQRVQLSG